MCIVQLTILHIPNYLILPYYMFLSKVLFPLYLAIVGASIHMQKCTNDVPIISFSRPIMDLPIIQYSISSIWPHMKKIGHATI